MSQNIDVTAEIAFEVNNVEDTDEAVNVAVSQVGRLLNEEEMNYVEITTMNESQEESSLLAAGQATVGLHLRYTVFDVESEEHAKRIVTSEIGQILEGVPIEIVDAEVNEDIETTDEVIEDEDIDIDDVSVEDVEDVESEEA